MLKDIHVRDKHEVPMYRKYDGGQIPVYKVPHGMGVLGKRHAEAV